MKFKTLVMKFVKLTLSDNSLGKPRRDSMHYKESRNVILQIYLSDWSEFPVQIEINNTSKIQFTNYQVKLFEQCT